MSALASVDNSIYIPGKMSAPRFTHMLKILGNGNMCCGVSCLVDHGYLVGNESGYIEGYRQGYTDGYDSGFLDCLNSHSINWKTVGISAAVAGGVVLICAGVNITIKWVKRAKVKRLQAECVLSENENTIENST